MARIELRDCNVIIADGLSGTGAVNEPVTPPVVTDISFDIDTLVLNTVVTTKVPLGARFTIAGETDAAAIHTVTARTQGPVSGVNAKQSVGIDDATTSGTFTLAWGGKVTGTIAYNGDAAAVKTALVAMDDGYGTDDWAVTGGPGPTTDWVVEFKGALGQAPRALLVGDGALLVGGTTTVTVATTVVGVLPVSSSTTIAITFDPALGAGTYVDGGVVTFLPQNLDIKIGEGNLTYTEHSNYDYLLDRGDLDTVREGDQVPMDVKLEAVFEHITQGTSEFISPMDAMKGVGGAAEWVSASADACEPYSVDVIVLHTPPCGTAQMERVTFPDFRSETREINYKDSTIALTGKCKATEPTVVRE